MAASRAQITAVFFILMLAGHEAIRLNQQLSSGDPNDDGAADDAAKLAQDDPQVEVLDARENETCEHAKLLQKENQDRCKWSPRKLGCGGGDQCRYRPLPFDHGLSHGCRLTDTYMLSTADSRSHYGKLQAAMLSEKAQTFREKCQSDMTWAKTFRRSHMCIRRGAEMMQAGGFLSKLQQSDVMVTLDDEVKSKVEDAMTDLASAFGDDGEYMLKFKTKVTENMGAFAKNPIRAARATARTMAILGGKDEAAKEQVKANIDAMQSGPAPSAEDLVEAEKVMQMQNQTHGADDMKKTWRAVDMAMPWGKKRSSDDGPTDVTASLMEYDEIMAYDQQAELQGGAGLMGLIILLTLITTILIVVMAHFAVITGVMAPYLIGGVLVVAFLACMAVLAKGPAKSFNAGELQVQEVEEAPANDGDFWEAYGMTDGQAWTGAGGSPAGMGKPKGPPAGRTGSRGASRGKGRR